MASSTMTYIHPLVYRSLPDHSHAPNIGRGGNMFPAIIAYTFTG
ncbi:MAG: hypothetical protein QOH49_1384 [Acidobacteriota bacterium]|nr:hypothetical protein [Acidobacteriota bacterium]